MTTPTEKADPLLALRYVLVRVEAGDRAEAAAELDHATHEGCPLLILAVAKALHASPALTLADVAAMLAARPALRTEADQLQAAGVDVPGILDPNAGFDPKAEAEAFDRCLAAGAFNVRKTKAKDVARLLAKADAAKTAAELDAILADVAADAGARIAHAGRDEETEAEAWAAHREAMKADEAGPDVVLRLDEKKRGAWAYKFNRWLGSRRGIEAGETMVLAGAAGAGKTSLAALLAVDALAMGCPVLFWQLELGRAATIEHLMTQRPEGAYTRTHWRKRIDAALPSSWAELLTVPKYPERTAATIRDALQAQARKAERARRASKPRHTCNGLVLVDYAQLLQGPEDATHEVICNAASNLAKAAAETGAVLVLLSQLNKTDQAKAMAGATALAGADIARMAHRVAMLHRAKDAKGTKCESADKAHREPDKGEARVISWNGKPPRGVYYDEQGEPPDDDLVIWNGGQSRAFHGGDAINGGDATNESWE